jgi:hypothetical protein
LIAAFRVVSRALYPGQVPRVYDGPIEDALKGAAFDGVPTAGDIHAVSAARLPAAALDGSAKSSVAISSDEVENKKMLRRAMTPPGYAACSGSYVARLLVEDTSNEVGVQQLFMFPAHAAGGAWHARCLSAEHDQDAGGNG